MKKLIPFTLLGLMIGLMLGLVLLTKADSQVEATETCPTDAGWTKVDSDDLSTYPVDGATSYCFKFGSPNSEGCIGGISKEWPPNVDGKYCGLSHWSYYIEPTATPTPTPRPTCTPTPTQTPTPTPDPCELKEVVCCDKEYDQDDPICQEEEPTPTPTPTEKPRPTPTPEPVVEHTASTSPASAPVCSDTAPAKEAANVHVYRKGDIAIVKWWPTEGNHAHIYYKNVSSNSWQYSVRDIENTGYFEIHALGGADITFAVQQANGCAGGPISNAIVDGPTDQWVLFR